MKNIFESISSAMMTSSAVNEGFTQKGGGMMPSTEQLKKLKGYGLITDLSKVVTNLSVTSSNMGDDMILDFDEMRKFKKELTIELLDGKGMYAMDNQSGKVLTEPMTDIAKFFLTLLTKI